MIFIDIWWLLKEPFLFSLHRLLAAGILGYCFCTLAHCVLGQLTRQEQPDCRLDLTGTDGAFLVVVGKTRRLASNTLEDIVDEGIHDAHCLARDSSVGVNLFKHFVDVDGVAFSSLFGSLLPVA